MDPFTPLTSIVVQDLKHQHNWSQLMIHLEGTSVDSALSRPIISGLPPKRIYVHPDEQTESIQLEQCTGKKVNEDPEFEWVLPVHLNEKISLRLLSIVFDAISPVPPNTQELLLDDKTLGMNWRGAERNKRMLIAIVHDDSTIAYYIVHDGIVKPRQN